MYAPFNKNTIYLMMIYEEMFFLHVITYLYLHNNDAEM